MGSLARFNFLEYISEFGRWAFFIRTDKAGYLQYKFEIRRHIYYQFSFAYVYGAIRDKSFTSALYSDWMWPQGSV